MIRRVLPLVALLATALAIIVTVALIEPWLLLPFAGAVVVLVALIAAGGDALFGRRG